MLQRLDILKLGYWYISIKVDIVLTCHHVRTEGSDGDASL